MKWVWQKKADSILHLCTIYVYDIINMTMVITSFFIACEIQWIIFVMPKPFKTAESALQDTICAELFVNLMYLQLSLQHVL